MFIQTEQTPNPDVLKFIPGVPVLTSGTADFASLSDAKGVSPLAAVLLEMEEIDRVFLAQDYISITKAENESWDVVKPLALTTIMDHFVAGMPVMDADGVPAASVKDMEIDPEDAELVTQIKALLEERVRPAVAQDGGDIIFRGYKEGIVQLELHGACSGCPSATVTLKNGIENMLKHYLPEVQAVEAVA